MASVIIIGGGAAGLMAAGTAVSYGHKVTLVEHTDSLGKKLLITGKGRCNVTNNCDEETFLKNIRSNPRFMYSSLYGFNTSDTMDLFERLGVPLKTERGRRVFPQSDRAADILAALKDYGKGTKIIYGKAKSLLVEDSVIKGITLADGKKLFADNVVIATGGMSYQVTGSTGDGYKLAKQVGHNIVTPVPSLVSLVERGSTCKKMMGLSLRNVNLTLLEDGKEKYTEMGEMLFTHFGVSGPLVLSSSAHIGDMNKHSYKISIDLKPALSKEQLYKRICTDFDILANKEAANCLVKLLPKSMEPVVFARWGIDSEKKVNQISKKEREELIEIIKNFTIDIKERGDLAHAVVTSGGVNTKEVNPKTMESKICKGLYFAGEVLDVDAYTGGYNLQIAFSTAYAACSQMEY